MDREVKLVTIGVASWFFVFVLAYCAVAGLVRDKSQAAQLEASKAMLGALPEVVTVSRRNCPCGTACNCCPCSEVRE